MAIKNLNLTLMIGPGVPLPAPREVMDALSSVEVTQASGDEESGFDLTFTLDKRSPLSTLFLISGGASIPLVRVILVATLGGSANVLIDGVVTHHQVEPGANGGPSTLKIQGKDLSAVMGFIDFSGLPFPAMPPVARAALILAKYAWLGIIPMTIPSIAEDLPIPTDRIPLQIDKDLDYLRLLARSCGHVFYIEPGPKPGVSVAYWGPEIRVGAPQPALSIDMDAHSNVESLSFRYETDRKEIPIVFIQESISKAPIPIPIPDVTPLNPPLGAIPPLPPKITLLKDTANLSIPGALMRGITYAAEHSDAVFANGTLDVLRYGHVLRSRRLVGVRGAGLAFDGLYYVKKVTHQLERGRFRQSFELARNGVVSTVPRVAA
ncbi:hypothetical protein Sa4125_22850 [Aureimonas sp. SA4125]|uniref:hypothetical protein n=1 Tax=Aureimonas sp. SA4125 TaxID=2826993 RepID=UPI001CC3F5C7|nr:hypothetical protein [Aureimonas sp. SA4125]BDA84743.1 hypothetical protein Sa4125_22850 [Aureimonas sp. SA4125]